MSDIVERLARFSLARSGELRPNADAAMADEARAEIERLQAAHSWQNICLAYQGDTQPCATPCLHCERISRALEGK